MATYNIDTTNWNVAATWTAISEATSGHTLDFSLLGAGYTVDLGSTPGLLSISDGAATYTVGDSGYGGGSDATLGGATLWSNFTTLIGSDGDDGIVGSTADDTIFGNNGNDTMNGSEGADRMFGEDGDDTFIIEDSYGDDTITGGNGDEVDGDTLILNGVTTDVTIDLTSATTGYGTVSGKDGDLRFSEIETIILSSGIDTIILDNGSGSDIVVGFKAPTDNGDGTFTAEDLIDVTAMTAPGGGPITTANITVTDTVGDGSGDAMLVFDGGETLTLEGVTTAQIGGEAQLEAMGFTVAPDYVVEGDGNANDINAGYAGDPEGDMIDANDNADGDNDDSVEAGAGDDTVEAGAGDDTIHGGADNDSLSGDDGDDVIYGEGGDDEMYGRADEDTFIIEDGYGDDTVVGGEAVTSSTDNDTLDLSALTTAVSGSNSGDEAGMITGGGGSIDFSEIENIILTDLDDVFSTSGDSTGVSISAGSGDDDLSGDGSGADTLLGGSGQDTFSYTTDLAGDDVITGGEGGTDNDVIDLTGATTPITVTYTGPEAGTISDGVSTVTFSQIEEIRLGGQNDTVDGTLDTAGLDIDAGAGNDDLTGGSAGDSLSGGAGQDTILGGGDEDTLRGGSEADSIDGGADDDSIFGDEGNDTLIGGGGADTIEAGTEDDSIEGGDGDDSINGDDGNDTIFGGIGNDFVRGSIGNDSLIGGTGNDYIWGGFGDDTIVMENDFGDDTISGENVDEIAGDTLDLSAITDDITVDLTDNNPEMGSVSDGVSTADFEEIENIILGAGVDTIVLADGSGLDTVSGFSAPTDNGDGTFTGNDLLDVTGMTSDGGITPVTVPDVTVTDTNGDGTGDAILQFPGGEEITLLGVDPADINDPAALAAMGIPATTPNFVVEGDGNANLIDAAYLDDPEGDRIDSNDNLAGNNDDVVLAGGGDDTIEAGLGADTVQAGTGNDQLLGEGGDDELYGEDGDDTFILENSFGADTIQGGENAETTGDTLDLSAVTDALTIDLTNANSETGSVTDGADTAGFAEIENILLGAGVDTLELADGSGSDTVSGFAGPTDNGDGTYTGNDLLDVAGLTSDGGATPVNVSDVTVTDTVGDGTGDAVLQFPGGESLTLLGVDPADITDPAALEAMGIPPVPPNYIVEGDDNANAINAGFLEDPEGDQIDNNDNLAGDNADSVVAGGGDDTVEAGLGDDTIDGGAGNDELAGEGGADVIDGGDGDDTFVYEDGFGADTVTGGENDETSGDTLDLSAVTADLVLDLSDANAETGSFTDGADTAGFTEIENIILGAGADTLTLADAGGTDVIRGFVAPVDNGDGTFSATDVLDVTGLTSDGGVTPIHTGDVTVTDTVGDGSGSVILQFPGGEQITFIGITVLQLGSPAQLEAIGIPAAPPNGVVEGTDGADQIDGAYADDPEGDLVDGADGPGGSDADSIAAGDGSDTVDAGAGDDTVDGGAGDDSLSGGAGNDTMTGDAGNDTLLGGAGDDSLSGGDDDDLFILTDGFGGDDIDGGSGGTDMDVIDATGVTGPVTITYIDAESGTLTDGTDTVNFVEIENILFSAAPVVLDGSDDEDGLDLDGGDGDDSVTSGDGDDTLEAGDGNDSVDAGDGDDSVDGGDGDDSLTGGDGDDTVTGGLGNDTITASSGDVVTGDDGDDVFFAGGGTDGSSFTIDGGEGGETGGDTLNISGPATVTMTTAESGTVTWLDGSVLTFTNIETVNYAACFTTGTMIRTLTGDVAIEHLNTGMMVLTRDHGFQPVRWIGGRAFSAAQLRERPQLAPVLVRAGALGAGVPQSDLLLSPQHRVLISGEKTELWFGESEVLVAAKDLLVLDGVESLIPEDGVHYWHFLCDQHEVVCSNGAWTESFQPGDLSLASLDSAQREEIAIIFPDLKVRTGSAFPAARTLLKSHQATALLTS